MSRILRPRVILGAVRAQWALSRRSFDDLRTLIAYPLFTVVFVAVLQYSGREDLAPYAIVATLLMNVSGMAFLVASELVARERFNETLELTVASPAPFFLILVPRIAVLTAFGLVGFVEAWVVVEVVFGISVTIHHVWLLALTLVFTVIAATGTAMITAAFFCFGRTPRTIQNSITFPLYILGGVLVPVSFLPGWLEPLSRVIFLYWAGELTRASMQAATPHDVAWQIAALTALGAAGGVIGSMLLTRMLDRLRQQGELSLV